MQWTTACNINLAQCFKVPWNFWIEIEFLMMKELGWSRADILGTPFFELLMIIERFEKWVKDRNEESEKRNQEQQAQIEKVQRSMPDYTRNMPKMPDMSKMQMPQMPQMPKFPGT